MHQMNEAIHGELKVISACAEKYVNYLNQSLSALQAH